MKYDLNETINEVSHARTAVEALLAAFEGKQVCDVLKQVEGALDAAWDHLPGPS